jgi:hypothetical protein
MIQSNKIFWVYSGCWDLWLKDEPKYSKNPIFKHFFFHAKSKNAYVRVFLSDLLKENLNKLFVFMVLELYLKALQLLMIKTAENDWFHENPIFDMIFWLIETAWKLFFFHKFLNGSC